MGKPWRHGHTHSCPLMAAEHRSNLDCVEYAVAHGDKDYVPELLRCACGMERLESSGTTVITDTDEHRVTLCRELLDRRKAHAGVCQCGEVVILDGRPNRMDGGWLHTVDAPCCELSPVVDLKLTDYLPAPDMVAHPAHYTSSPAKCSNPECRRPIECIDVTKHMNFSVGSMVKYLWRLGLKGDRVEQLRKVIQYAEFEIGRIEQGDES